MMVASGLSQTMGDGLVVVGLLFVAMGVIA